MRDSILAFAYEKDRTINSPPGFGVHPFKAADSIRTRPIMLATHAVGIDLGTTYSCIASLNEHGEPVSIANPEGELCTPSVVFFDQGQEIVGTEALRHAVIHPDRVIQNAKRYIGDAKKTWTVDGKTYTPTQISAIILRHLLTMAEKQIGQIEQAVITVPAQFSDAQRLAVIEAGKQAGLKRIDIINEPVAAALCYVLGAEGLWFSELANEQRILVYDLGGGTFDLSLVSYQQNEVKVIASTGDLRLGGIDWNQALLNSIAGRFEKETGSNPTLDRESLQEFYNQVELAKRSLTVRERTPVTVSHAGQRKTYTVTRDEFNQLTAPLLKRTQEITERLVKENLRGWAQVDVVLTTGGSSRMQMVKEMLKGLSGRTLNTSLSPDQSIAHGATYYAGMIISKSEFVNSILSESVTSRLKQVQQRSVTARGLGILVRDPDTNKRVPHYLIEANTPLPASVTQTFGTVNENQKRVHLHIVESGERADLPHVQLGNCIIESLPLKLPKDSEIAVTISYDASARVHVSAKDVSSGKEAKTEIVRTENLIAQEIKEEDDIHLELGSEAVPNAAEATIVAKSPAGSFRGSLKGGAAALSSNRPTGRPKDLDSAEVPIALCNKCGEPLNARGVCSECAPAASVPQGKPVARPPAPAAKPGTPTVKAAPTASRAIPVAKPPAASLAKPVPKPAIKPAVKPMPLSGGKPPVSPAPQSPGQKVPPKAPAGMHLFDDDDVIDLFEDDSPPKKPAKPPIPLKPGSKLPPPPPQKRRPTSYLDED